VALPASAVLYLLNSSVVDSGGSVDMRALGETQPGADDDTQSVNFTHSQDNAGRVWDPGNAAVTTAVNVGTNPPTKGYALNPYTQLTPDKRVLVDASGNNRHATIYGNPQLVASPFSGFGKALDCIGTDFNDATDGAASPAISPAGLTACTLEFKWRRDRAGVTEIPLSWLYWDEAASQLSSIQVVVLNTNFVQIQVHINGVFTYAMTTPATIATGNHTMSLVWDGSTYYFFDNGTLLVSAAGATFPTNANMRIWIGRMQWYGAAPAVWPYPSDGVFDEVRLSNSARYTASYTVDSNPWVTDANTMALYHMDKVTCRAALAAGAHAITFMAALNQTGGTYVTGSYGPNFHVSLWRYNLMTNTATRIESTTGSGGVATNGAAVTWNYTPATGDLGTFKLISITFTTAEQILFEPGETLLLEPGLNTATVPNPTLGTATWTCTLRVDNVDTKITLADTIAELCGMTGEIIAFSDAAGLASRVLPANGQASGAASVDGKLLAIHGMRGESAGAALVDGKFGVVAGMIGESDAEATVAGQAALVNGARGEATVGSGAPAVNLFFANLD
jgi:hypothetical protein